MSEPKDFTASLDSDSRRTPLRVAFVTRRTSPQVRARDDTHVMTYPEVLLRAAIAVEVLLLALATVSLFWDAPLEGLADPMQTPNPAKAPWYFLGLQEMLVYFDPWIAGVVMPTLIIVGLMAIPYIDANPLGNGYYTYRQRRFAIWTFCAGFIGLWVAMISIGTFIRGPGWMWFWPGSTWDAERVEYAVNRNLDTIPAALTGGLFQINGSWIAHLMPEANRAYAPILARIIFGFFPIAIYFLLAAYFVYLVMNSTEFARRIFRRMSLLQIVTTDLLLVLMLALPVKILLRLVFRIKYIWVTPWFSI